MPGNAERLFDEFKRVDKICGDMFSCQHGISAYLSEMERVVPYDKSRIYGWDRDYRELKRVRWLRNRIAHETAVVDCSVTDCEWLEEFHARILEQRDPLAQLGKMERAHQKNTPKSTLIQSNHFVYRKPINIRGKDKDANAFSKTAMAAMLIAIMLFIILILKIA